MVDRPVASPSEDSRTILLNRVAWGAVFAGVVLALVTQLILNMIGLGIGVSTLNPTAGANANPSPMSLSIGAGLWFVLSGVVAAFAGGYAAGRLAGKPKQSTGGWHGLTTWALTTLIVFYLLTSAASSLAGSAYGTLADVVGGVGRAMGPTAQTAIQAAAPSLSRSVDPFLAIENQIRGVAVGNDPAALRDAAVTAVRDFLSGDPAQAQAVRDRATLALARVQSIPEDQARARVQQFEQEYRQAVDRAALQARQAADAAARGVSRAALFGSFALLLGALASWLGGRAGTVYSTPSSRSVEFEVTREVFEQPHGFSTTPLGEPVRRP
ncbi:PhnA-like protein [Microvirga flavescens]|uniref:PhnA-like protein n=1 Tax=Microvirga flavescens TaxID=2249811 RepID=UPI0018E071FE|nr:PhnA-like protein [Microvirga flavescens]